MIKSTKKEEEGEDTVEEVTQEDGSTVRTEIHKGPGFQRVRITSDGKGGSPLPGGPPSGIMKMVMDDMMKNLAGAGLSPPQSSGRVEKVIRIPGPMGGQMTIRQRVDPNKE